jgi:hypothetical protein
MVGTSAIRSPAIRPLHDGAAQCRHRAHDSVGHEDGLRLIEDRKCRAQASKAMVLEATGCGRIPRCVQDTRRQALHLPPDMATLRDGGACRQLKRVSHGP